MKNEKKNDKPIVNQPMAEPSTADQAETTWDRWYSHATQDWFGQHDYCQRPARRTVIRTLVTCFRAGMRLCDARYEFSGGGNLEIDNQLAGDASRRELPQDGKAAAPTIVLDFGVNCFADNFLLPGGLFPPECDYMKWGWRSIDDMCGLRTPVADEALVVCTLATLLCQRGIRLSEDTLFHLYPDYSLDLL